MLYTIENKHIRLTVSNHGAEIKSLVFDNVERIHDSNPAFWNRSAPLLFPCIGTITNKETIINDKAYALSKHGFLRDQDFELVSIDDHTIVLKFHSNETTLAMYPFTFEVIVKYEIENKKMLSSVNITNLSHEPMPFNFGLHPAFKTPISEDEKFEDYELVVHSSKDHPIYKVELSNGTINFDEAVRTINFSEPLPLNYDDYLGDALVFDNIDFDEITLQDSKGTHGVSFTFPGFPMLGIWTPSPKRAPFICLEPWIGCADPTTHDGMFIHKKHMIVLNTSESKEITYTWRFF